MVSLRLERFRTAQAQPHSGFDSALAELRAGRKVGHWIWYVFPQLSGLGISGLSQKYAISGEAEAEEYLRDPLLLDRLLIITRAVAEQLDGGRGVHLETLMGSSVDVLKLVSSLTLFGHVAGRLHAREGLEAHGALARAADEVLGIAARTGYARCEYTRARLTA